MKIASPQNHRQLIGVKNTHAVVVQVIEEDMRVDADEREQQGPSGMKNGLFALRASRAPN